MQFSSFQFQVKLAKFMAIAISQARVNAIIIIGPVTPAMWVKSVWLTKYIFHRQPIGQNKKKTEKRKQRKKGAQK